MAININSLNQSARMLQLISDVAETKIKMQANTDISMPEHMKFLDKYSLEFIEHSIEKVLDTGKKYDRPAEEFEAVSQTLNFIKEMKYMRLIDKFYDSIPFLVNNNADIELTRDDHTDLVSILDVLSKRLPQDA